MRPRPFHLLEHLLGLLHARSVHPRRSDRLARLAAEMIPPRAGTVLDVGTGDGLLARRIQELRPDLEVWGADVLVRPETLVPLVAFDGRRLPLASGTAGAVTLIDVLHHSDDPEELLREAARVAREALIVKDHLREGWLAAPTLRFMDRAGNVRHGVALPSRYWTRARWREVIARLGLEVACWKERLALYPPPLSWFFERSLHFLARLERPGAA